MINQNEQFPKIRFHNYCDEWKQQKLGEVFEQTSLNTLIHVNKI